MRKPGVEYTPQDLSLDFCRRAAIWCPNPEVIWDPACGEGALLRAAEEVWPDAVIFGTDIDAEVAEKEDGVFDFLFDEHWNPQADLILMNPPWIGQVSKSLGGAYAKRVQKKFDRDYAPYNAASDLCAAFLRQAADYHPKQISVLATNTAWQGRTRRSGHDYVTFEHNYTPCTFGGWTHPIKAEPPSHVWPGKAAVHYGEVHYVHRLRETGVYVSPGHEDRVHPGWKL